MAYPKRAASMRALRHRRRLTGRLLSFCLRAVSVQLETVAKVNSLTILLARLSRLCREDEAQGAEGEV